MEVFENLFQNDPEALAVFENLLIKPMPASEKRKKLIEILSENELDVSIKEEKCLKLKQEKDQSISSAFKGLLSDHNNEQSQEQCFTNDIPLQQITRRLMSSNIPALAKKEEFLKFINNRNKSTRNYRLEFFAEFAFRSKRIEIYDSDSD